MKNIDIAEELTMFIYANVDDAGVLGLREYKDDEDKIYHVAKWFKSYLREDGVEIGIHESVFEQVWIRRFFVFRMIDEVVE